MRYIFLCFIVLCLSNQVIAQRHIKGIYALDAMYSNTKYGQAYQLGFVKYYSNSLYGKINTFFESAEQPRPTGNVKANGLGLDLRAVKTLFTTRESIFLNADVGLTGSYEYFSPALNYLDSNGNQFSDNKKTIQYGAFIGIEGEVFINDKIVFLLNYNQRYLLAKNFGGTRYYASIGVRYNLN